MSCTNETGTANKRGAEMEDEPPEKLVKLDVSYLIRNINRGNVENVKQYLQDQKSEFKPQIKRMTPLHFAAQGTNVEIVQLLIDNGYATMDAKDGNNKTPLHIALDRGHIDIIKCFFDNGAKKFFSPADIQNQIKSCFIKNRLDILKFLIEEEGMINDSLIHYSVTENRVEILKYLLECGKINKNPSNYYFLHKAAEIGNLEIVKLFFHAGFNITGAKNFYQKTPLHFAVAQGHIEVVKFLMEKGAKSQLLEKEFSEVMQNCISRGRLDILKCLHSNASFSNPLLYFAASNDRLEILKYLLECGGNSSNSSGSDTALHGASERGSIEIVKYLVERGHKCVQNSNLQTPLDLAVMNGRLEVVQFFMGNESSKIIKTKHLFDAVEHGHLQLLKFFIDNGCGSAKKRDRNKYSLLHSAALHGHLDILKYLLANGAEINLKTNDNETPLFCAIREGHVEIVRELLQLGAENKCRINAEGLKDEILTLLFKAGATMYNYFGKRKPIFIAADLGFDQLIKALIESGVDVNVTRSNQTPLDLAVIKRHSNAVHALLEGGADPKGNVKNKIKPFEYVICQRWSANDEGKRIQVLRHLLDYLPEKDLEQSLFSCINLAINEKASLNLINVLLEYDFHNNFKLSVNSLKVENPSIFFSLIDHIQKLKTFVDFQDLLSHKYFCQGRFHISEIIKKALVSRVVLLSSLPGNSNIAEASHARFIKTFGLEDWNKRCQEEIACMRHLPGEIEITYYDFLAKPLHKVEKYVSEETLMTSFSSCISSQMYEEFFKIRVKKVKDRRKYIVSSKTCIYYAVKNRLKIDLPEEIVDKICEYLTVLELKRLSETLPFLSIPDDILVD